MYTGKVEDEGHGEWKVSSGVGEVMMVMTMKPKEEDERERRERRREMS